MCREGLLSGLQIAVFWLYHHMAKSRESSGFLAQRVKRLPTMQETWVLSLGWEDSLEKEMATHSSILAWRIPWAEESGRLQSMGSQRVGLTHTHTHTHKLTGI